MPPGCPVHTYRNLIEMLHVPCILDVGGAALAEGVPAVSVEEDRAAEAVPEVSAVVVHVEEEQAEDEHMVSF